MVHDDSDGNGEQLQRKYRSLCTKYEALVKKLESVHYERGQFFSVAWWALRSSSTALAVAQDGRVVLANEKFGELDQAPGRGAWQRDGEETDEQFASLRDLAARESQSSSSAQNWRRRYRHEGSEQTIEIRFERTPPGSGRPAQVLLLVEDVTERARVERQTEQHAEERLHSERMRALGEMASGVAHDLNNTLNALSLRVSLLAADATCRAAQGATLEALTRILRDAEAVVGRLQDFARRRQDRPDERVDLRQVLADAVQLALGDVTDPAVAIESDVEALPEVQGNATELKHVFLHLLTNAREAMPRGGTIRVVGRSDGKRARLEVIDEGTGIAPAHLPHVFDPFFTTKGPRGTGLGLSMAYGVVHRMGGHITAENRPSGGARLLVELPAAALATAPAESRAAPRPNHPRHVLLVDDDRDHLEAAQALLELDGDRVDVAESGHEAIDRVGSGEPYDVVFCDVGMPQMSGWQLAAELRRIAPSLPVYLLTGWALEIATDDPRRRLVAGVLGKPMNLGQVRALIAGAPT